MKKTPILIRILNYPLARLLACALADFMQRALTSSHLAEFVRIRPTFVGIRFPTEFSRIRLLVPMATACSLVVWVALAKEGSAQDRVYPIQGATASGTIAPADVKQHEITIEVRGKKQTYPINEIRKVSFDDEPPGLDRARELVLQEQYEQAQEELRRINAGGFKDPLGLAKQDFEFYRWYCEGRLALAGHGDKVAASNGLRAVARVNPQTYHFYPISELLGELALAQGKPADAALFFSQLTKAPFEQTKEKGKYRLGEVELASGKIPDAKLRFEEVVATKATTPEMARIKSFAEVGLAVCASKEGKAQAALAQLQQMVQKYDSSDSELFARIYNAQGACNEALGQINQAVIAYLHTDLMFFADPQAHAEALYNLTVLWPKVNQPQRAQEARQRLVKQYASSSWANKK